MCFLVITVLFVSLAFCSTAEQTDWSGGPEVYGPVGIWGDTFWSTDDNVVYNSGKLYLVIPPSPLEHNIDENFEGAESVCSADLDGDGDADVLGAALYDDDIIWWENVDGTGTLWVERLVDANFDQATSVCSADLDGDGDTDILGAAFSADNITWWENVDGTGILWIEHTIDGEFDGARSVHSCDVDGDGDVDVLGAAFSGDKISWWENAIHPSGISWIEHTVDGSYDAACAVYSADIDGDGDADVLGAAYTDDAITWWENIDGTGTLWTEHLVDGNFDKAASVYSSDMDGDGDADILGAANADDDITWWENSDTSPGIIWTEHTIDANFNAAHSVYTADMDCDGDIDVLGGGSSVCWWENSDTSPGILWTKHTVDGSFHALGSVYSADINGDGYSDILGAAPDASKVSWWDIQLLSLSGALESSVLNAGDACTWNTFLSNSQEPDGTSVSFQFRSSKNHLNMGSWSDTVFAPDISLEGILADSTRYLQYKVILETSDSLMTPELEEVSFIYTVQMGVGESDSNQWSLHASENPSNGLFSALVSVQIAGIVQLCLYDVSGRVIANVSQELVEGAHSVNFTGLASGVYFCTMRAGEFSATRRVVVLK